MFRILNGIERFFKPVSQAQIANMVNQEAQEIERAEAAAKLKKKQEEIDELGKEAFAKFEAALLPPEKALRYAELLEPLLPKPAGS